MVYYKEIRDLLSGLKEVCGNYTYLNEKITEYNRYISILYRENVPNDGHSREQHGQWALQALNSLKMANQLEIKS